MMLRRFLCTTVVAIAGMLASAALPAAAQSAVAAQAALGRG